MPTMEDPEGVTIGVLTASDRASSGDYEDLSGPEIEAFLTEILASKFKIYRKLVPDQFEDIKDALIELCDISGCSLIFTTGGTGPAPRDVTPEATLSVCDKVLPGFGERMRSISLKYVPTAILSRQVGGTRGSCLIINLPGSPRSIRETLEDLFPAIPYCIDLIGGPYILTLTERMEAYRPPHARRE
tara:strand:- start:4012 stop:4572 length:561 start_codon:yes stop_codon:yes gene_type:complete